ncbi:MAG: glycosyltransferase [Nitrospirota bacterium]
MNEKSLTVVFSTRTDNPAFRDHVKVTCGIDDVEILQYINDGEYSLTEIYNRGLRESKNTIVAFTHDDVVFESESNWGRTIINHFRDSDFGILGKAGTTSITESGRWWDERHLMVGIVWHEWKHPNTGYPDTWESRYSGDFGNKIIETIMVDGVFFVIHKERIKNRFDEVIKGFHFYDVDFSLANHLSGVKVGVVFDMKIIHKSIGITNKEWERNRIVFLHKWQPRLPYRIDPPILYDDFVVTCRQEPEVALIIYVQNGSGSLIRCIESIRGKARYPNYKLYILLANTDPESVRKISDIAKKKNDIILVESAADTPARAGNSIVKSHVTSDTELLLFCHDDVELLNDALSRCVQIYIDNKPEIGILGARLHLGNNTIQHAGIQLTVDKNGRLRISHKGYGSFYNYTPGIERDIFSNSGAFMMVNRDFFLSLGGFSERYMQWLEDIDLNIRAILAGRVNYLAGDAVAYHYELETNNSDPGRLAKQSEDLGNLLGYIYENLNNPMISKHLRHTYA